MEGRCSLKSRISDLPRTVSLNNLTVRIHTLVALVGLKSAYSN